MIPENTLYADAVNQVSGDQLNTMLQVCSNIAQLRSFIAKSDMQVSVAGSISPGDGGGGIYYWNANSTGPDNGTTIIVPTGSLQGAWVLLSSGGSPTPFDLTVTDGTNTVTDVDEIIFDGATVSGTTPTATVTITGGGGGGSAVGFRMDAGGD
jgi:hypothetical protein